MAYLPFRVPPVISLRDETRDKNGKNKQNSAAQDDPPKPYVSEYDAAPAGLYAQTESGDTSPHSKALRANTIIAERRICAERLGVRDGSLAFGPNEVASTPRAFPCTMLPG